MNHSSDKVDDKDNKKLRKIIDIHYSIVGELKLLASQADMSTKAFIVMILEKKVLEDRQKKLLTSNDKFDESLARKSF
jgi:hypothetical protein